jgi:hypothetical protein
MKAGDAIELPCGVVRSGGSWTFRRRRRSNGRLETLVRFTHKDYEEVIAFAKKWCAEHDSPALIGSDLFKTVPRKVVRRAVTSLESFVAALPSNATAFSLENTPDDQIVTIPVTAGALRILLAAHADLTAKDAA